MISHVSGCALVLVIALVGCGGKAVVDGTSGGGGEAGAGTTSTTQTGTTWTTTTTPTTWTTSTWTTSSTATWTTTVTTTDICTVLEQALASAYAAAIECNPALSVAQCTGSVVVYDQCGCSLAANALYPELAADAVAAYDAWVAQGCGPWLCEWCPPPPPNAPWFCMPSSGGESGQCQPAYED